jgi:hypothetical protein
MRVSIPSASVRCKRRTRVVGAPIAAASQNSILEKTLGARYQVGSISSIDERRFVLPRPDLATTSASQ